MRKLILILSLLMINVTCFATTNFSSSTGNLAIPEVLVDGATAYDNVTLQLNRDNGTFIIQGATLKDALFPENPLQTTIPSDGDLIIEYFGCVRPRLDQIICMEKVVNPNRDIVIHVFGDTNNQTNYFDSIQREFPSRTDSLGREYSPTSITDGSNRRYSPSSISANDKSDISLINLHLIEGVPVEIRYVYNNIDPSIEGIIKFQPLIVNDTTGSLSIGEYRPDVSRF